MTVILVVLCLLVFFLLLLVAGVQPVRATMSVFELERRKASGDRQASAALNRENLASEVLSMQRSLSNLLLVILASLLIVTFGWLLGIFLTILIALEYNALSQLSFLRRHSQRFYDRYEPSILQFAAKYKRGFLRLIRVGVQQPTGSLRLDSREELEHLVTNTHAILTSDEKKLILHGLKFNTVHVSEVMTPRSMIEGIEKKELLGPLVLDDLHKTGHSRFPVIDSDIDHVIGMLYIQDLLTLDMKRSTTAEKAMEPRVFYIHEDQTLDHALAAFLRTHHHLFIVVNEFRETVGLLSIEDVIEALLGHKIIDEFDSHEDLAAVAKRRKVQ